MPVIIEDGSQVVGANSYASESDLELYADQIGVKLTQDSTELLLKSALYVETLVFKGYKLTKEQRMQWPRGGAEVDGWPVATTAIPSELIKLQNEVALLHNSGVDPMATPDRLTKKEKVGDIEVEYMGDKGSTMANIPLSVSRLSGKLTGGGSGVSFRVYR